MPVLLCDLDDTLFDHERATREALANLREGHQVLACWSLDELDARHRVLLENLHVEVLASRLTIDDARCQRFTQLLAQAGVTDGAAGSAMAHAYRGVYAANWHPVPGAIPLLQAIRDDGHVVLIVTNNGVVEQETKLDRCGLRDCIHSMITSEETGFTKPDGRIFHHALGRVGASPSEAVMLGDAWVADIEGARAAGISAVWFNRARRPSPDRSVPELASLEPLHDTLAVLRRAGLGGT